MSSSNCDALAKIIVEGDSMQIVRALAQEGKFAQEGNSYSVILIVALSFQTV